MKEKILHVMNWKWNNVSCNMELIKDSGFTAIQVSPCQPCKKLWNDNGRIKEGSEEWNNELHKTWWKSYQILSMSIGNYYGTKEEWIEMCNTAHAYGIKVIQDVIIRHIATTDYDESPNEDVDKELLKYINKDQSKINNYHDRRQVIERSTDCIMLDYENEEFQNKQVVPFFLEILKYADGLRFDELKHIGLPSEGYKFLPNVFSKLPKDKLYYGECLQVDEYFLRQYMEYMKPLLPYGEGWNLKHNCVAFKESNDTCNSFLYTLHMTDKERLDGYEECLRQYGNAIFYARRNDHVIFSRAMKEVNSRYN